MAAQRQAAPVGQGDTEGESGLEKAEEVEERSRSSPTNPIGLWWTREGEPGACSHGGRGARIWEK